jgi:endonuclease YncB( thermonuclease family)
LAGEPFVLDADTLVLEGEEVQLYGIDAPENAQLCEVQGVAYACGEPAAEALHRLLSGRPLTCTIMGSAPDGDELVRCRVGATDVQDWLVSEGWALADPAESSDYLDEQRAADHANIGIWRGHVLGPWVQEKD